MKTYTKPTIDFIELKPEERLACGSGHYGGGHGHQGGGGNSSFIVFVCSQSSLLGTHCSGGNFKKGWCK